MITARMSWFKMNIQVRLGHPLSKIHQQVSLSQTPRFRERLLFPALTGAARLRESCDSAKHAEDVSAPAHQREAGVREG